MSDETKPDSEDALHADGDSKSGKGAKGGLPDEGIEGDEGRGTGEGDAGPASGSSGPGSGG